MKDKNDDIETIEIKNLLKKQKSILLTHENKCYRLSITRRGKLILTAAQ